MAAFGVSEVGVGVTVLTARLVAVAVIDSTGIGVAGSADGLGWGGTEGAGGRVGDAGRANVSTTGVRTACVVVVAVWVGFGSIIDDGLEQPLIKTASSRHRAHHMCSFIFLRFGVI